MSAHYDLPTSPTSTASPSEHDPPISSNSAAKGRNRIRKRNFTPKERAIHSVIERQRREALNERFVDLARLLPTLASVRRLSKGIIVNGSITTITAQRNKLLLACRELRALLAERDDILVELNNWRSRGAVDQRRSSGISSAIQEILEVENEVFGTFTNGFGNEADDEDDGMGGDNDTSERASTSHPTAASSSVMKGPLPQTNSLDDPPAVTQPSQPLPPSIGPLTSNQVAELTRNMGGVTSTDQPPSWGTEQWLTHFAQQQPQQSSGDPITPTLRSPQPPLQLGGPQNATAAGLHNDPNALNGEFLASLFPEEFTSPSSTSLLAADIGTTLERIVPFEEAAWLLSPQSPQNWDPSLLGADEPNLSEFLAWCQQAASLDPSSRNPSPNSNSQLPSGPLLNVPAAANADIDADVQFAPKLTAERADAEARRKDAAVLGFGTPLWGVAGLDVGHSFSV